MADPDDETRTYLPGDATRDPGSSAGPDPRRWSVPGYEILGELGRGGMGVVYRAREIDLDREVALKVLLSGSHAGPTERARFRAEAEAAAALRHPHTVQVFRVGEHRGLPFLALELVPGGTLADRLKAGPVVVADAVDLVEKAARAVAAAHAAGISHRDLKPANILLTAAGEPKVADFGLARRADSDLTASGVVMGTPAYMAPEQARGNAKGVGPAADVWALGVILYEALTGRPPFRADSPAATLRNVLDREPPAVRRLRPGVTKDLQAVCLNCLEKDPRRRYVTAAALADDLARCRRGDPVTALRPPVWARAARRAARHKGAVALVAAVLLTAAGTAVVLSLTNGPAPTAGPGLPADLAAVPPDAAGFVTVRVAVGWAHPGVQAVAHDVFGLGAELGVVPDRLHALIGLRPGEVERATVVLPTVESLAARRGDQQVLFLIRTAGPVDLGQVRAGLEDAFGPFARQDYRDRWYLTCPAKPDLPPLALFALTDRDLAVGTAGEVRGVIDRLADGPAAGPLTPALADAPAHTVVVAARPTAATPDRLRELGLIGPRADDRTASALRTVGAAGLAVATIDLLPAAADHPLPGLDVAARFDFADGPAATAAVPAVRTLLDHFADLRERAATGRGWEVLFARSVRPAVAETTVSQVGAAVELAYRPRWTAAELAEARRAAVATDAALAEVNRYRSVGFAVYRFADARGQFPRAVVRDEAGRPLWSWRVELLPFLGEETRYRRLKPDEPWDGPHNKPLLADVPPAFQDAGVAAPLTRVQAVVGPGTVFGAEKPVGFADITDGTVNTLLAVEAAEPVHWAEPKDYVIEPGKAPRVGRPGARTFLAVMGDAHVETLTQALPAAVFEAAATWAGGEVIDWARLTVQRTEKKR